MREDDDMDSREAYRFNVHLRIAVSFCSGLQDFPQPGGPKLLKFTEQTLTV